MISEALGTPGLWGLIFAAFLASVVRGFSGFGTGMIYIPIASRFVDPIEAIATMAVLDFFAPMPLIRPSLRIADRSDLLLLSVGLVLLLPVGLYVLVRLPPDGFGWIVSLFILAIVAAMMSGWRYQGKLNRPTLLGIGGVAGFTGGFLGLPGPPAILTYMASSKPVATIRANLLLFLFLSDVVLLGILTLRGDLTSSLIGIGLILAAPAILGVLVGSRIFNPDHETTYRRVAYGIIIVSALFAMPLFH